MILGSDTITFARRIMKYPAPHYYQFSRTAIQENFLILHHTNFLDKFS